MEDERKAKWGSLSDEAIQRLAAVGVEDIVDKWGLLSEAIVNRLKEAGFIGLPELSGMTSVQVESALHLNSKSSTTADFCQKLGWALEKELKGLKVDLPAIVFPTHQARQEGLFLMPDDIAAMGKRAGVDLQGEADKLTPKDMAEIEARLTEEVKGIMVGRKDTEKGEDNMIIGLSVEPQKGEENRLVVQLMSEGVKPRSAQNLAAAFPEVGGLEDIYKIAQTEEGPELIRFALRGGPAAIAVDNLFQEKWGNRPLGTNKGVGHKKLEPSGVAPEPKKAAEEPLSFLADKLSVWVRRRLSQIPELAGAERIEQILAFLGMPDAKETLFSAIRGGWGRIMVDNFCEDNHLPRLFGTKRRERKKRVVTPPSEPTPPVPVSLVLPLTEPTHIRLSEAINGLTEAIKGFTEVTKRNSQEEKILVITQPLFERFSEEVALRRLHEAVDLILRIADMR